MDCARQFLCRLFLATTLYLPTPVFAGDGPQNTGSLTLGLPGGQDQSFEAQLQIDRKVLKATFGEDSSPDVLLRLFDLFVQDSKCAPGQPSIIDSEDVVTAALRYQCTGAASTLSVRLTADQELPEGFTLGVRTPFDHFVLSRADGMTRTTITSGGLLFFRAGISYLTGGTALESARIGRAHALYYGGLSTLPPGIWLLLLVLAIWCTRFSLRSKLVLTSAAVALTGIIAVFVMQRQASLNLIPVRSLGFIYLALLASSAAASFIRNERSRTLFQMLLLACAMIASGLEHAVVLRWLEGQEQLHLPTLTAAFMSGVTVAISVIVVVSYVVFGRMTKNPETRKNPLLGALPVLLAVAWPALAMFFKWI